MCLSNGTTEHRAVNASLQVHYFKSFQRVLSRLGVICPALFTGQPAPPEAALLGRAQREREGPLTATRRLLKGFQTAWEGCSARRSSRASDQRLQRLFLGGAEGPPRTETTRSCTEAVPLPCPADVTVQPLKPLNLQLYNADLFRPNRPIPSIPSSPPPAATPSQPARAYCRCPGVTHMLVVPPLCSP